MKISRVALDLAKNVIQVHAVDRSGAAVVRKALKRAQLLSFLRDLSPCEVGMEACASAHHWGRLLQAMGHTVHLLPAQYVKPFVIGQKNDANDAAAICAAMGHSSIPRVTVKTIAQQDMQALHRTRSMKMKQRTAIINQTRGLLAEYGIVIAKSPAALRKAIPELLEDADNGLSFDFRQLLSELYDDLLAIDKRVAELTQRIERTVRTNEEGKRLLEIHRPADGQRPGRDRRRCPTVQEWSPDGRLPGIGAATTLQRRQGQAARHPQTRRQLPAWSIGSRRTQRAAHRQRQARRAQSMADEPCSKTPSQHRHRGASQQERQDRLGDPDP